MRTRACVTEGVAEERASSINRQHHDRFLWSGNGCGRHRAQRAGLTAYSIVTLHRPSNVDDRDPIGSAGASVDRDLKALPLVFAVHPRTRKQLIKFELLESLEQAANIRLSEPLGYIPVHESCG